MYWQLGLCSNLSKTTSKSEKTKYLQYLRKNIEYKIGNNKYAMTEYGKLKRISFPIGEKYLLKFDFLRDDI